MITKLANEPTIILVMLMIIYFSAQIFNKLAPHLFKANNYRVDSVEKQQQELIEEMRNLTSTIQSFNEELHKINLIASNHGLRIDRLEEDVKELRSND